MRERNKIRYEIKLAPDQGHSEGSKVETRSIAPTDRDALAQLMLDAYMGTIDYEGETINEALDEVDAWFDGSALLEHSYVAIANSRLVSAILTMSMDEGPFIAIVMTDPAYKNAGLGRTVTERSLESLANAGHVHVAFYITEGNTPSERLFESLGAERVPPG